MRGYEAQDAVFRRRLQPLSMQEARDLAGKLFATFGVEPIEVKRTSRGGGRSRFWYPHGDRPGWITLWEEAPDWIVCHEVAHYVAFKLGARGHGVLWAGAYVEAVRAGISEPYARRLELSMRRHGLA